MDEDQEITPQVPGGVELPSPTLSPQIDPITDAVLENKVFKVLPYGRLTAGSNHSISTGSTVVNVNTAGIAAYRVTYDTTNYRIYAIIPGLYLVWGALDYASVTGDQAYGAILSKNGGSFVANWRQTGTISGRISPAVFGMYELAKGDYVDLRGDHTVGSDQTVSGNIGTYLAVVCIHKT